MTLLEKQRQLVFDTSANLRSVFENIEQAIFTIDSIDGRISEDRSNFFSKIFKSESADFFQILKESNLSGDAVSSIKSLMQFVLNEDPIEFTINNHLLPSQIILGNDDSRTLQLKWSPIIDQKGIVRKILVCAQDITQQLKYQKEIIFRKKETQILMELLNNPIDTIQFNIEILENLVRESIQCCKKETTHSFFKILRDIHTIKGNARMLTFTDLSDICHKTEEKIRGNDHQLPSTLREDLDAIKQTLELYSSTYKKSLQSGHVRDAIPISRKMAEQILEFYESKSAVQREEYSSLHRQTVNRFDVVIASVITSVSRLSGSLAKPEPKVNIVGAEIELPHSFNYVMINIMNHLFRNAIDHGLELPEEREKLGKNPSGEISIIVRNDNNKELIIDFRDDGAGLDLKHIVSKAKSKNLNFSKAIESMEDQEIAELIFIPGFSTKDIPGEISGRGIGMDAVREYLEDIGGSIKLVLKEKTRSGRTPIEFEIRFPPSQAQDAQ